jgi:hypothetical protein
MKIKSSVKAATLVAGFVAIGMTPAFASLQMTLSDGAGHSRTIIDNVLNDSDTKVGEMTFIGAVGGVWQFDIDVALSKPVIGGQFQPTMDLSIQSAYSTGAGTLTITLSDSGFGPLAGDTGVATLTMGGLNIPTGSVTVNGKVNTTTVVSLGPLFGTPWSGTAQGGASGLASSFGLTEQVIIQHNGAGNTGGDIFLSVIPETSTWIAGACLLLPFSASAVRFIRKHCAA